MTRWAVWGTVALVGGAVLSWQGFRHRQNADPVLARVGRTTVTQKDLAALAEFTFKDSAMAKQFLNGEANKARRAQAVESIAITRAMLNYSRIQGLEQDPKYRLMAEQAQAQAAFQMLLEKRVAKLEATDADLKKLYDEISAERKANGQDKGLPEFEMVKDQLRNLWKQRQTQKLGDVILKEIKAAVPISYTKGYQPEEAPAPDPKAAPPAAPEPAKAAAPASAPAPVKQ